MGHISLFLVVALLFMGCASAATLELLWEGTLTATTSGPPSSSGYAALFGTTADGAGALCYAVTTSDGNLTLLNASTGAMLWSVSNGDCSNSGAMAACWARQVVGDAAGVAVLQGDTVYLLSLVDGGTQRTLNLSGMFQNPPSAWGLSLSRAWNGVLVVTDGSRVAGYARNGAAWLWTHDGLANGWGSGLRFDNANGGTVAFLQNATRITVIYDVDGGVVASFDVTVDGQDLYVMAVDSTSVTYVQGGFRAVCRRFLANSVRPSYCLSAATGNDYVHGYGLANARGRATTPRTRLYLERTAGMLGVDFDTGVPTGLSAPGLAGAHPQTHLVGMAQFGFLSVGSSASAAYVLGCTFGPSMPVRFNFSVPGSLSPYTAVSNWDNEILVPTASGFYVVFGADTPQPSLNSNFTTFLQSTGGTVQSNTWVTHDRIFITSGSRVMAFGFKPSA